MRRDAGFTLIETMIALCLLLVVATGVLPLGLIAMNATENQGHLMARTVEYAQDKLEQLMALSFGDTTSDTRVFPALDAGGTGLTAPGGSANPDAPVVGYVDYLDRDGTLFPPGAAEPAGWYYKRVWLVSSVSTTLKQITVTVTVRTAAAAGTGGMIPRATVTVLKTSPF